MSLNPLRLEGKGGLILCFGSGGGLLLLFVFCFVFVFCCFFVCFHTLILQESFSGSLEGEW